MITTKSSSSMVGQPEVNGLRVLEADFWPGWAIRSGSVALHTFAHDPPRTHQMLELTFLIIHDPDTSPRFGLVPRESGTQRALS